MAREKTSWGTVVGTGAASIDIVMQQFPLGREVSEQEILSEIARQGLKSRGAIAQHMWTLTNRGHIAQSGKGWKRITA
jgi:hypothetical protein